jgi:hypothetical protein
VPQLAPAPSKGSSSSIFSVNSGRLDDVAPRISGVVQYGDRGIVLAEEGGVTSRYSLAELDCGHLYQWSCKYKGHELRF